jgi:hypothetical protein
MLRRQGDVFRLGTATATSRSNPRTLCISQPTSRTRTWASEDRYICIAGVKGVDLRVIGLDALSEVICRTAVDQFLDCCTAGKRPLKGFTGCVNTAKLRKVAISNRGGRHTRFGRHQRQ